MSAHSFGRSITNSYSTIELLSQENLLVLFENNTDLQTNYIIDFLYFKLVWAVVKVEIKQYPRFLNC